MNYGWDFREGKIQGPSGAAKSRDLTDPVFDYPRDVGQSITGGYVYHGPAPGLEGAYFFGDFVTGRLFTLRMANGVPAENAVDRTAQIVGAELEPHLLLRDRQCRQSVCRDLRRRDLSP